MLDATYDKSTRGMSSDRRTQNQVAEHVQKIQFSPLLFPSQHHRKFIASLARGMYSCFSGNLKKNFEYEMYMKTKRTGWGIEKSPPPLGRKGTSLNVELL